ncbi:hypothetical protein [Candidatus Nitrosocosmicus sp. R]
MVVNLTVTLEGRPGIICSNYIGYFPKEGDKLNVLFAKSKPST